MNRRQMLAESAKVAGLLASVGAFPHLANAQAAGAYNAAAFEAKNMADLLKAMGGSTPVASKDVVLKAPDIAENGAVVPLGVASALPGVKSYMLLVEKNPSVLSAVFHANPSIVPDFTTRVKMGQTSNVFAVALMNDGKVFYSSKEVKVTLGGCGG